MDPNGHIIKWAAHFIDDVIDVKEWNSQLMYSGKVVKFIEVTKSMLMIS